MSQVISKPGSAAHENHRWKWRGEEKEWEEEEEREEGREVKDFPRPTARWSRVGYLAAWPLPGSLRAGSPPGKTPLPGIPPPPATGPARDAGVGSPPGPPRAGTVGLGENSGGAGLGAAVPGGALGPVAGGEPVVEEAFLPQDSQQSLL